jgi:hypothetical protein
VERPGTGVAENLEQAVADGDALKLAGHACLETRLSATIQDW